MSAWTKGPWEVGYHGSSNPIIVTVFYPSEVADAHLIAAAPEMYEALANLLSIDDDPFRDCGDCDREESGRCAYHELCDAGAAAIAKARGEVQS